MPHPINKGIALWLFSGIFLIMAMVIIGGITRLTGSGLSITEWKIVTGTLPPMNETSWAKEFDSYRQSPQFIKINSDFTLNDFKFIYFWEYIHRLTGRVIGIVFIIPFFYFLFTKQLSRRLINQLLFVFLLGAFQGFLGWYMVKSGLIDNPHVSHFRLAAHLITAFITCGVLLWIALDLIYPVIENYDYHLIKIQKFSVFIFIIILFQIVYGAFVAGLKAGHLYNTFPMMGEEWIASSVSFSFAQSGIKSLLYNPASVQFVHRCIALIIIVSIIGLYIYSKNLNRARLGTLLDKNKMAALRFLFYMILVQFLLGVLTLIYNVPIVIAVLHQLGAFILFSSALYFLHRFRTSRIF